MREAWIRLECPSCQRRWEVNPSGLPSPRDRYACAHCGARRTLSEFTVTRRELEILDELHQFG